VPKGITTKACGRDREGEQFDLGAVGQGQVELVGVALRPDVLGDHAQAENLGVEALRHRVVGADHSGVVDPAEHLGELKAWGGWGVVRSAGGVVANAARRLRRQG